MPRKSDLIPINNELLDKRVKLTKEQKKEIKENKFCLSQRKLATYYNVSRRTIQFILDENKLKENIKRRIERGGSKIYYDKEYNTQSMKKHRDYKKELFNNNLIYER